MNKQVIKIMFVDFWSGFEVRNNYFLRFLEQHFDVVIDPSPDYLFYSVYGFSHLKYDNCIKILYTGENIVPDFNLCDYALGFHYLNFDDRYMRLPLYVIYPDYENLQKPKPYNMEKLFNRKFCNFVYSNNTNAEPTRSLFFEALTKYKKVDSGGRFLNNIGGPVVDKRGFIRDYKFSIAFENSVCPGYTTEKIMEPMLEHSMPVYYGNPLVHLDFNSESFVIIKDANSFNEAIEEIIVLDQNNDKYLEKLSKQSVVPENNSLRWEKEMLIFFDNIFRQPLHLAKRKPGFGYNKFRTWECTVQADLFVKYKKRNKIKANIKSFFGR